MPYFCWLAITLNKKGIKISFEDVYFYAKLSLVMDTPVRNSTTQWTIIVIDLARLETLET